MNSSKVTKAIAKLIRQTQDEEIRWNPIHNMEYIEEYITRGTNNIVDLAFEATVDDTHLLLYESKYKTMGEDERIYWDSSIVLEIINSDTHTSVWRFPLVPGMWDLLSTVKYKSANVDTFLDDFLSEEAD